MTDHQLMDRSTGEIVAWVIIATAGLVLLGFLGFAFMFGAADHTEVSFQAEQLSAVAAIENITYDPPPDVQPLVERTIAYGSSLEVTLGYDPFFEDAPDHQIHGDGSAQSVYVEDGGTFYRISMTNSAEVETQRQTLELVPVNETRGDVIAFDELPAADQRVVSEAYVYWVRDCDSTSVSERAPPCWRPYSSRAANESILLPTPPSEYIRYQNQTFEIVVRERTVDSRAIAYEATAVANNSAAFPSVFVRRVDEDNLTDDEYKLLEQAIGDGYHIRVYRHEFKQVPRERFNALLPKLGLPTLDHLSGAHHESSYGYILYRGDFYRVHIEYSDTYA